MSLILLPTDTCYWLAWSFTHEDYIAIYKAKWRDFSKQLAILVRDFSDMQTYIEISDEQIAFLRSYPHPWSFLGKKQLSLDLPDWMDDEKYSMISVRVAGNCIDANIRDTIEYPLFLTSANLSWQRESRMLQEAQKVFPWVEWIDWGICDRLPSDIFSIGEDGILKYLRRNYWL
jgi:tRNA A37 threonylcarbamoyladenosine synthetase subunit TsaC/SUA5/YrdC